MSDGSAENEPVESVSNADVDRLFVEALLEHHYRDRQDAGRARADSALRRLFDDEASAPGVEAVTGVGRTPALLRRWNLGWSAAAAALVLLVLLGTLQPRSVTAAIAHSRQAMSRPLDQHYRFEIRTVLDRRVSGELWVRGESLVVLRHEWLQGERIAGEGRDSAWVVPPLGGLPVRVAPNGALLNLLSAEDGTGFPFARLTTVLDWLGESFELEFGADRQTVEARRKDGVRPELPRWVQLRFGPDGVVREFAARWDRLLGVREVAMTWLDADRKPSEFYEHGAHHDAGRRVVDRR